MATAVADALANTPKTPDTPPNSQTGFSSVSVLLGWFRSRCPFLAYSTLTSKKGHQMHGSIVLARCFFVKRT